MAVSLSCDPGSLGANLVMLQRQDRCDTKCHVSADIDPSGLGPLNFRESTTLEMENSVGRHCSLLDKYLTVSDPVSFTDYDQR